jgi:cob(I)alamin adenosyltransferase
MKGYLQVYTGDGKGKTTAAIGLAVRAAGAGLKVFLMQFLKKGEYSEIKALRKLSGSITVRQCGSGKFIKGHVSASDKASARSGLKSLRAAMIGKEFDVVIADELNPAVSVGALDISEVLDLVSAKPENVELVITGRGAHPRLLKQADLVTEMRCRKHYFSSGVRCRKGVEY